MEIFSFSFLFFLFFFFFFFLLAASFQLIGARGITSGLLGEESLLHKSKWGSRSEESLCWEGGGDLLLLLKVTAVAAAIQQARSKVQMRQRRTSASCVLARLSLRCLEALGRC